MARQGWGQLAKLTDKKADCRLTTTLSKFGAVAIGPHMFPKFVASRGLRVLVSAIILLSVASCAQRASKVRAIDALSALAAAQKGHSLAEQRAAMVQAIRADVRKAAPAADTPSFEKALGVIGSIRREEFVLRAGRKAAYIALPQAIGYRQTISDPYVVAIMTGELHLPAKANVLDVGTGSGYEAAVLSRIASRVSSIEIVRPLAISAAARLRRLAFLNVDVRTGDGFLGWPDHAPFDGIVVAASASAIPPPLLKQLKPGGHLVMPIGPTDTSTQLLRITKRTDGAIDRCSLGVALFVPLTGQNAAPFARAGLIDRSIPMCYGRPIVSIF